MKGSLFIACAGLAALSCTKSAPEPTSDPAVAAAVQTVSTPITMADGGARPTPPPPASAPPPPVPAASGPLASTLHPALLDVSKASEKAPSTYKAKFTTSRGEFVVEVHRDWAPNGADRFYNLVKLGFYDDTRFFRAISGFMVQFGINGDPAVNAKWQEANIPDDAVSQSNKPGFISFAQRGTPNSRSTQVFINYGDNKNLDGMRFAPFGQVVKGTDVVQSLYQGYGEGAPRGAGPDQGRIQAQGNAYLDSQFPKLDAIKHAEIMR
ncbi:MAG: peptidylprolyl isomerase [Polyangiaceae bacterium]|nr:peptidylprolyl isomerase [Polyangiaceae bacterium]